MHLANLTFRHPRVVAVLLLIVIAGGISALSALGRQEDPTITNLYATITTSIPGADPGRVEALVSVELEEQLRTIPEIETLISHSGQGSSIVHVELQETLSETEIQLVWAEARDAVERAASRFPPDALTPDFDSEGMAAYSAVIAVIATDPRVTPSQLTRYASGLAERLRLLPATRSVDLFGAVDEEVLVEIGASDIAALGLPIRSIAEVIRKADGKLEAGRVQTPQSDLAIGVSGAVEDLGRLRTIPLLQSERGDDLRLGDVARISRGARSPPDEMALAEGGRAVLVGVLAQEGVQIDRWMQALKADLSACADGVPVGMSERLLFDQSTYTLARLKEVGRNMAIGMALVILVLLATLGLRSAAIVALVLPVVTLATLASMLLIGLPVHQMSITGLIVALGLLVDAAIVMTDEIRQRLDAGMARGRATADAVGRLAAPLAASTVTTALAFLPMILLPGPSGDFVSAIAISVVLMVTWSFVVAMTVTPALAGRFLRPGEAAWRPAPPARAFASSLSWSVRKPVHSLALSLVLPVLGFLALPHLTAQFFPTVERNQFFIELDLPVGSAITQTYEKVTEIDAWLQDVEGLDSIWWTLGRSGPAFYYNIIGGRSGMPGYAEAMVTTTDAEAAARLIPALQARLDRAWPEAQIVVRGLAQGPPVAAPVELRLVGPDAGVLRVYGDDLRRLAAELPTTTHVRTTLLPGAPRLTFEIDESKAHRLGLSVADVAAQMDTALIGAVGGSMVEGAETMPIRVRLDTGARTDPSEIFDLPIIPARTTSSSDMVAVPLSEIAMPRLIPSDMALVRRNGERTNTVQVFSTPGLLPAEVLHRIETRMQLEDFTLPPGYRMEIGGDSDARASVVRHLMKSLPLVATLMVATIALTLNSFRLTAVAFAVAFLSGGLSVLSLALMQYPFGVNAIVGVIGSVGVSVNAAIIILTALQRDAGAATGDRARIVHVTMASSRHILSTTITTFVGFLPLVLGGGGFWPPFAMAVAGGVALSTLLSFYFVPAAFVLMHRSGGPAHGIETTGRDAPRGLRVISR